MSKRDGHQKGPQAHAEGQHGERTRARFLEQLHHPVSRGDDSMAVVAGADEPGAQRLESRANVTHAHDADAKSGRDRQRR
jgi:hypothetical protein